MGIVELIVAIVGAAVAVGTTVASGVSSSSSAADASAKAKQISLEEQERAKKAERRSKIASRHEMGYQNEKARMDRDQYRVARTQQIEGEKKVDRDKLGQMLVNKASTNQKFRRALWDTWGARRG